MGLRSHQTVQTNRRGLVGLGALCVEIPTNRANQPKPEMWMWVRLGLRFQQTVQTNRRGIVGVGVLWFQNRNNMVGSENVMFLQHTMNHHSIVGIEIVAFLISEQYCGEKRPRDVSAAHNESPQYCRKRN